MIHPDKYKARRYDTPDRCREFADTVYHDRAESKEELWQKIKNIRRKFTKQSITFINAYFTYKI